MLNLFSKDEELSKSAPLVGAEILKILSKESRVSIFHIAKTLKKNKLIGIRAVYYGMIFLYTLDLIDFDEPYLVIKNVKT